ncbi:MAG TPA: alpha/beta hydrolase [Acidobacteriaceae bacterium]|nr:alpha/beta hydrolase [Acidobacteriaceae bacterium]
MSASVRMARWATCVAVVGFSIGPVLAQPSAPAANPHAAVVLWANGAPGSEGKTAPEVITPNAEGERTVTTVNAPSIAPYLVRGAKAPTAAVIVMPGGGHYMLSIDSEGYNVAQYLAGHGVAAFVLKYRLAKEKGSTYTVEGNELDDVQRAIRLVRANAAEWNIDPARVGVMGFSAGGELAVMAATRWHDPTHGDEAAVNGAPKRDAIDSQSDKPAFEALMYPGGLTVPATSGAGASSAPAEVKPEILEKVKLMGPAFMLCGANDRPEIAQALPQLFVAARRAGVPAEIHEYAGVGHGFGLRLSQKEPLSQWAALFVEWMDTEGLLRGK